MLITDTTAQSVDELKKRLSLAETAKQRVDAYNALANLNWDIDYKQGRLYTDSAYQLATSIKYEKGIVEALINIGLAEFSIEDFKQAMAYFERAYTSASQLQELNLIDYIHNLKANLLIIQGDFILAEEYLKKIEPGIKKGTRQDASYSATLARLYFEQGYTNYAEGAILRAYNIRRDSGYTNLLASAATLIAKVKTDQAKYKEAETYFLKALDYAKESGLALRTGTILIEFAEKKILTGSYDSASILIDQAFKIFDEGEVEIGRMMAYKKYAEYYLQSIDYVNAQEYALKALQIAEQIGAKKMQADIYVTLAWIYKDENNFDLGLDYLNKALTLQQGIGYKRGESGTYNTMGNIYNLKNEYNLALDYFNKALEIRTENGYLRGQATILYNIGLIKEKQGDLQSAKTHIKKSLEINLEIGHLTGLAYEYNSLAGIELKQNNVNPALQYLDFALSSAKKYNDKYNLSRSYKLLSQVNESRGDYKKAFEYGRMYEALNDSLFNIDRSKQILELQSRFELQSKDQEIALLNARNESAELLLDFQNATIDKQRTYIISISVGLILMAFIAYILFKYNQSKSKSNKLLQSLNEEISEQKEDLRVANEKVIYVNQKLEGLVRERTEKLRTAYHELDTFFYKSSHDFRRPITTFLGLAEVARYTVKDKQALELFEKVKETAINIDKMLAKLQSISYVGSQELVYKSVYFEGIIQSLLGDFDEQLKAGEVDLNYKIKLDENFVSYPLYISIILENLIENAIVFNTSNTPKIDISIQKNEEGRLEINVSDNGVGIQEEYQSKIFEMYYRGNDKSKGNGLGLYIVKKAVDKLRGNISFRSVEKGGTAFTVTLPFN
jgi:signal transduction histidine kinase/tetratricopeptide (TPR) repeat protein